MKRKLGERCSAAALDFIFNFRLIILVVGRCGACECELAIGGHRPIGRGATELYITIALQKIKTGRQFGGTNLHIGRYV